MEQAAKVSMVVADRFFCNTVVIGILYWRDNMFFRPYFWHICFYRLLKRTYPAWMASILFTIIILGGLQLLFIGIIGQYLARIYTEAKQRPLFFIDKKLE